MIPRPVCLEMRNGSIQKCAFPASPSMLCLGNFDGVHVAHAALIREGMRLTDVYNASAASPARCGVFCFFRPSGDYFLPPNAHPTHLTTLRERLLALHALGVDLVWLCDFPSVRNLPPEDFMRLLRETCGCVGVACGYNHRFGHKAAGTPDRLKEYFGHDRVSVLPAMEINDAPVSSSRIRACLAAGDAETAATLLGRPYALKSRVLHGKSLGHTWGFPTANQCFPADRLIPAHGVYAVICHTPKGLFPGVANIGLRPTVEAPSRVNCETHIIGFSGDLYGKVIQVDFCRFLRPEQKFESVDALKAAIQKDTETAAEYGRQVLPHLP